MNRRKVEERIGYVFKDGALLERAFTHSSACARTGENYQDLEFLGDSVLGFAVSRRLYSLYPDAGEGVLTKMRACVVSERPLARAVDRLGIAGELIMGDSERKTGIETHDSIKCDLFESVTAAIYLDGGFGEAEAFVLRCLDGEIAEARTSYKRADAKSCLNEYVMKKGVSVEYREELREGAPHLPVFVYSVYVGGERAGEGRGASKREAQQAAAAAALTFLRERKQGRGKPAE